MLDDDDAPTPLIPTVSSDLAILSNIETVVVIPLSMKIILDSVDKTVSGSIKVEYPQLTNEEESNEDYDEDTQLYSAVSREANSKLYQTADIAIYKLNARPALAVVVPHFTNPIVEKVVAAQLVKLPVENAHWIILAPCVLNNGVSLCRLDAGNLFTFVPKVQPPHFITGIGAAVVSELAGHSKVGECNTLILNAEGHPGYEKVDADSLMEAAEVAGEYLVKSKTDYIKKLSHSVRKINSSATSGMYI